MDEYNGFESKEEYLLHIPEKLRIRSRGTERHSA